MRPTFRSAILSMSALLASAVATLAVPPIYSYDLFKSAIYSQSSTAAPVAPDYFIGVARIITSSPADLNPVSLNYAGTYNGAGLLTFDDTTYLFYSTPRSTIAALDADFPVGTYTYRIWSAFPYQQSATLMVTATALTPTIPAFTGDTYDRMQAVASGLPFSGGINGWAAGPVGNEFFTFVEARDVNTGEVPYTVQMNPQDTGFTIDPGTLLPNSTYQLSIYYSTRNNQSPGGFGGALRLAAWDAVTIGTLITTAPTCVLDYNGDTVLNPDDLGDFITDYFTDPPISGPGGYSISCAENDPPYDAGYKAAYTPDGSGQCNPPFPDNLGDFITDYFATESC